MDIIHLNTREHPVIHHVTPAHTLRWLKMGYQDLQRAPADTVFYGAAFVLMGFFLAFYFSQAPQLVITFATVFLLAGPFLAIGLYDIARQLETPGNSRSHLSHSMMAWRSNVHSFSLYAVLLAVLVFGWFRMSMLMFALFFDGPLPTLDSLASVSFSLDNLPFLVAYFGTGLVFAVLVFGASVLAIPMMLDKEVDTVTAVVNSLQAVWRNPMTMVVWAAIIVALTVVGFATYFVGLLVIMPIIGLASWHAYRDLITYE